MLGYEASLEGKVGTGVGQDDGDVDTVYPVFRMPATDSVVIAMTMDAIWCFGTYFLVRTLCAVCCALDP